MIAVCNMGLTRTGEGKVYLWVNSLSSCICLLFSHNHILVLGRKTAEINQLLEMLSITVPMKLRLLHIVGMECKDACMRGTVSPGALCLLFCPMQL